MKNVLIVSCIFGTQFKKVHQAPHKSNMFFTNNPNLKEELLSKGWNYIYVKFPLSSNLIISSLQSKYIKFLQFLKDFPQFENFDTIIYYDHKENINYHSLVEILELIFRNQDKSIIIRQTPSLKNYITDEISVAKHQPRYAKNMDKTVKFIRKMMNTGEISNSVRICNTGLIIYIHRQQIAKLINDCYEKCIEHEQPECQIYWAVFSQRFKEKIHEINWTEIKGIKRYDP